MTPDQGFDISQPHAFSRNILFAGSAENLKYLFHIILSDTIAVVLNMKSCFINPCFGADVDHAITFGTEVIHCVLQNIAKNLLYLNRVADHLRQ